MNNAIMLMVYDRTEAQHELSRKAFESAVAQDIPVDIFVLDNGSTYRGTPEWLIGETRKACFYREEENISPLIFGNRVHGDLFQDYDHVLCIPNDVIMPPNLYRKMLEWPQGLVAAGMHGTNPPAIMEEVKRVHGDVHLSVTLVRKSAHDALVQRDGFFMDEGFFMYASDCDLKMRLDGIPTAQLDILCWHYGGASHRLSISTKGIYEQADKDRDYFTKKWGFPIGSPEYDARIAKL
jgi:hypothetical protein